MRQRDDTESITSAAVASGASRTPEMRQRDDTESITSAAVAPGASEDA